MVKAGTNPGEDYPQCGHREEKYIGHFCKESTSEALEGLDQKNVLNLQDL